MHVEVTVCLCWFSVLFIFVHSCVLHYVLVICFVKSCCTLLELYHFTMFIGCVSMVQCYRVRYMLTWLVKHMIVVILMLNQTMTTFRHEISEVVHPL